MNKKSKFAITEDDLRCLKFLWLWKITTTMAIYEAIYSKRSLNKCYRRLLKLENQKYIESIPTLDRSASFWQLTEKGFKILNFENTRLSQIGFRSENPDHDFWASIIHFGAWGCQFPRNAALFTEQQLRRYDLESYASWVPQTKQHRPDGWWKTDLNKPNSESLVALEVELSKKSPENYKEIGEFYSNMIEVKQVIWVVKSSSFVDYILNHLKSGSSTNAKEHSFILLDHFIKNQWQVKISTGYNAGVTLKKNLDPTTNGDRSVATSLRLLDIRKYPINTATLKIASKANLRVSRHYNE